MIKMTAKLLKVLNSETEPEQISVAICFSMIMGFTPLWSLHNLVVLLLVLLIRVNLSAFILALGFFSAVAYALDPVFHMIGLSILTAKSLESLWTALYSILLFRLDGFNNSISMGSLITSILLFIPLFFTINFLIRKYRDYLLAWIRKARIVRIFQASKLYKAYQTVSGWGGD